ncbi:MAG TPA: hypothetical protein PLT25_02210, partial [Acidocella sp.]|nr:hypothetical protein [Acidocella sp.]
ERAVKQSLKTSETIRSLDHQIVDDFASKAFKAIENFDNLLPNKMTERLVGIAAEDAAIEYPEKIKEYSLERLNAIKVFGKPLSECTAFEALAWCDQQDRDVEFVRRICHGVPSNEKIGHWYKGAHVDLERIYKEVNSEESFARRRAAHFAMYEVWTMFKTVCEESGDYGLRVFEGAVKSLSHFGLKIDGISIDPLINPSKLTLIKREDENNEH